MNNNLRRELLTIAQDVETTSRKCRNLLQAMAKDETTKTGEVMTVQYCGALLSLSSGTMCELYAQLRPIFDRETVNGVLREWRLDELLEG